MRRTWFTAALAVAIFSFSAESMSEEDWPTFTYQDLKKLIIEKKIRSVEELTAALPEELQTNITFRLKPHNRVQDGVRAIRFTSDGALTITHNDDPQKKGGFNVEAHEVDSSGKKFLHDIKFAEDGKGPPQFSDGPLQKHGRGPESCITCHGEHARKIWPSYRDWPDACGENDDTPDQKCSDFLKKAKSNTRFKDLKWDPQNPNWPYMDPNKRALKNMPNTRLTYLTLIDNAREQAQVVRDSALYKHLKYTLLYDRFCEDQSTKLKVALSQSNLVIPPSNWTKSKADYIEEVFFHKPEYTPADKSSKYQYPEFKHKIMELFNIPLGMTGGVESSERNAVTGIDTNEKIYNSNSNFYLNAELLRMEAKTDPNIKAAIDQATINYLTDDKNDPVVAKGFYNGLDSKFQSHLKGVFLKSTPLIKMCPYLKNKSEKELTEFEKFSKIQKTCDHSSPLRLSKNISQIQNIADLQVGLENLQINKGKELLSKAKCIACHDSSEGKNVGPHIPFANPKNFAKQNQDGISYADDFISSTERMISNDVPKEKRMPLNQESLSPDEQKALIKYLNFMASQNDLK